MKKTTLSAACTLALTIMAAPTYAEIKLNGFASIVGGMTLDDDETLYGYDDKFNFDPETRFALQGTSDLGNGLSATIQLIARGSDQGYDVGLEWGYLSYEVNSNWRINAGKIRNPQYRYSDYLDVGYAYPWVRPPKSIYNTPVQTITGFSVIHTSLLGDWDSTVQFTYGSSRGNEFGPGEIDLINNVGLSWELVYDWFSVRAVYLEAEATLRAESIDGLLAGFSAAGLNELVSEIDVDESPGQFVGIGFGIDREHLIVQSEWNKLAAKDSFQAEQEGAYVSLGYRLGKWTPHITYETLEYSPQDSEIFGALPSGVGPDVLMPVTGLVYSLAGERKTTTVGVRYEIHPSAALKIDVSKFKVDVADEIPVPQQDVDATVVSFAIDLLF